MRSMDFPISYMDGSESIDPGGRDLRVKWTLVGNFEVVPLVSAVERKFDACINIDFLSIKVTSGTR